jgi:GNAT superfamily N-acetyltransferase
MAYDGRDDTSSAPVIIQQTAASSWRALIDDQPIGMASVHPGSVPEARFVRLSVDPPFRRCGIGGMLIDSVGAELRRAGCRTAEALVVAGSDGELLAHRLGATIGDELVDDVLSFDSIDPMLLKRICVLPAGYDLRHWAGPAPGGLVESYALVKRSIADAPNRHPPPVPVWDPEMIRVNERARADRGAELWVEAAVVAGTGEVVAFTEIEIAGSCAEASQVDTAVLPAHRRKGLATAVKADLLLRLLAERPNLGSVSVTCALANTGMRAVNHRLGFREQQRRTLYRLDL